ncbi:conserved hypothetical protein [Ricinus communis]|uniref:Uncharacterized protein n=1 Tax=Ricinus communis TaxID=3988 RepID=B9SR54_RICCO|nr:conserved hypothetical protein [Ricinus communis]
MQTTVLGSTMSRQDRTLTMLMAYFSAEGTSALTYAKVMSVLPLRTLPNVAPSIKRP